jgi:hypothetical protein
VLLDFPPERRGSETPLEYIIEEDRRRYKTDEIRTGSLEQSVVWNALAESFHESIGKVRVFCHPDHAEFLTAFLKRSEIESMLAHALHQADTE